MRKAIKEKIVIISMNAIKLITLVKTVESVMIYQELSNALVKMILKDTHVKIHVIPTQIIVGMVENATIKLVYMLVTAKGRDVKESVALMMSMNAMLKIHAKTMVSAKMRRGVFPVNAITLHIKGTIANNLNTVSMVLLD